MGRGLVMLMVEEIKGRGPAEALRAVKGLETPFLLSGPDNGYSYCGAEPKVVMAADEDGVKLIHPGGRVEAAGTDPFAVASDLLASTLADNTEKIPFTGGAVGYFSYDLKNMVEPGARFKHKPGTGLPLAVLGFYDTVFAYDNLRGRGYLVSADTGRERFERIKKALSRGPEHGTARPERATGRVESDFTREGYIGAVKKALDYISRGDIYQINLSQRLVIPWSGDPLSLFMEVDSKNPTPYGFYMDFGGFQVVSNTPERLLKVEGGVAETSPIKGTRPRGRTPEEDAGLVEELKTSRKERSEHVMIVDLERNDLGRVSVPGTVEVTEFEKIETYPGLHHMVSTVRGKVREGTGPVECLRVVFPGGSITGAPKVRAMEIIDELEPTAREVYTGCVGWAGWTGPGGQGGALDMSMAIRTAVVKDGRVYLRVGGGIVADSDPGQEYEETMLKAESFLRALGLGKAAAG